MCLFFFVLVGIGIVVFVVVGMIIIIVLCQIVVEYYCFYVVVWLELVGGGGVCMIVLWYEIKKIGVDVGIKYFVDLCVWWCKGGRLMIVFVDGVSGFMCVLG